jgi:P27 family predicted phage terminase small subunit
MPDLECMGVATEADAPAVAAWCEALVRLQLATRLVESAGLILEGREGTWVKNPAVAMARDASHELRLWARELGLTPSARSGIRVVHEVHGDAGRLLTPGHG